MKANRQQVEKALKPPLAGRLFLFHGPDEAGSRALVQRLGSAAGQGAERVDLTGAELKADPARLSDEAASLSMFGDARYVVVSPAGEECLPAVAALLDAQVAGNPVALVAGTLKPTSKLLKLCIAHGGALAFASYLPDARDWDKMVTELGRPFGLTIRPDVARRIAEGAGGNRALIEQELAKLALFLDADPGRPAALEMEAVDEIGAGRDEGDTSALMDHVFEGRAPRAEHELARLRSEGVEGITLLRAALRRAMLLAKLRARVEGGESAATVLGAQRLFGAEKDSVPRQLGGWDSQRLQRCVHRLIAADQAVKRPGGMGPVAADAELLAIARQARRR